MTNRTNLFTGINSKDIMNALAVESIEEIMSDTSTTAVHKVIEIALVLKDWNRAQDIKKLPAVTESKRKGITTF